MALFEGHLTEADALLSELDAAVVATRPELEGLACQIRAQVLRAQDDLAGAVTSFARARDCYARDPGVTPIERAELMEAYACAAEAAGEHARAADLLRETLRDLDATSAEHLRHRLDGHLKRVDPSAWLLHRSGRFVGHGHIRRMLHEGGQQHHGGELVQAAVLFSDLRGFTSLAEGLAPDVLVDLLNRYFGHMTRCVEHFGGEIDKFIGDAGHGGVS